MRRYGAWLFLLFLVLSSYIIVGAICGYVLWGQRHQNGKSKLIELLSGVMWGICIMGFMEMVASAFGYIAKPHYTIGYAWSFWIGRAVFCVTLWRFALFMLQAKKGKKSDVLEM